MSARRSPADQLLAARLAAQRLSEPPATSALETTRHLLAVQAQDPRAARLAIRARSRGGHSSDVDRALTDERSLIISWVNRGTLHLLASEDEPLLHALTTSQLRVTSERRLRQEGISPHVADRAVSVISKALGSDGPMTRRQLRTVLERAGVPTAGQAFVHILLRATIDGLIVRGPMIGTDHAFALYVDWLGERPKVERDAALAELARRYLIAHGPADEQDLAKWAGLPLRDARTGLKAISRHVHLRPDGLLDLGREERSPRPSPRLLGPFDPLLLGWRSRELVLDGAQEVVTANGIFRAIAIVDGRAAGTWTLPDGKVKLNLWNPPARATLSAFSAEATGVETYLASLRTSGP
jgi:Winged helix DNA-binding domain